MEPIQWTTERRKLGDLAEWDKNPRQLSKHDAEHIRRSIEQFGLADPLVVNADGQIIGGHQRKRILLALQEYGPDAEIDVRVPSRPLTKDEAAELNVRLNRNSGEWDWDVLANEFNLDDLLDWGFTEFDFQMAGVDFGDDEPPEDPGPQIDRAAELQEKWGTALGQLWQLGDHRLICGDCTDAAVVDRVMDGERALLMATDPPYGDSWVQKARDMHERGYGHSRAGNSADIMSDDLSDDEFSAFLATWLDVAVNHALVPPASVYVWHGARRTEFDLALRAAGLHVHQLVVWVKPSFVIGRLNYHPKCEWALHGWVTGNGRGVFYGERNQSDVWEVERESGWSHPTQKPVELWMRPIANHLRRGEILFDPFIGSGTAFVAAEQSGVRCYGVELKEDYVAIILQRWHDMTGRDPVLVEG